MNALKLLRQIKPTAQPDYEPQRIKGEAEHIHIARTAAIKELGVNWLMHPDYAYNPRHSYDPEVYQAARAPYLAHVAALAAADRSGRRDYQTAQRVRAALETTT